MRDTPLSQSTPQSTSQPLTISRHRRAASRRFLLRLAAALALLSAPSLAAAETPDVDTALVLAADASGSMTSEEFAFQKDGIAQAITDSRVLEAIAAGAHQRIAIAYVEWGGPGAAQTVVPWHVVSGPESAETFAARVLGAPRSAQSYNAIGDAIDHSVELLRACPCRPVRQVIDVSGDNADMRSLRPAPLARDAAVARRITINALAILVANGTGHPDLVGYYETNVIGGQGAFALAARGRADFARALREKMIMEIASDEGAPEPVQAAETGAGRAD